MQTVDVLRYNGTTLALAFPLGQLEVSRVRLCIERQHFRTIEAVKLLGFAQEERMAENGLRRVFVLLVVQTVHRAEIRNAALGRYARTAEKDDIVAAVDPLSQFSNLLIHDISSFRR